MMMMDACYLIHVDHFPLVCHPLLFFFLFPLPISLCSSRGGGGGDADCGYIYDIDDCGGLYLEEQVRAIDR